MKFKELKVMLRGLFGMFMLTLVTSLLCVLPCFIKNEILQDIATSFLFFYFLSIPFAGLIMLLSDDEDIKKKKVIKNTEA